MIGGRTGDRKSAPSESVESHSLDLSKWTIMPSLIVPRAGASSCYVSDHVYIFCGLKQDRIRLNSIERIRSIAIGPTRLQTDTDWQLI